MVRLTVESLSFKYDTKLILNDIHVDLTSGKVIGLIGPNASGKSTLLKCMAKLLKPEGNILLDGQPIRTFNTAEYFKIVGYVPQESVSHPVLRVFEAILLGNVHSLSWRVTDEELAAVVHVLDQFGIEEWALRYLNELSGGQRQLVSIAQAFIKQPNILLLDEPTSHLDLQREFETLDLIKQLTKKHDLITLVAVHNLNTAARFADEMIVLNHGHIYASGPVHDIVSTEMLQDVYGMRAHIAYIEDDVPTIIPLRSIRQLQ